MRLTHNKLKNYLSRYDNVLELFCSTCSFRKHQSFKQGKTVSESETHLGLTYVSLFNAFYIDGRPWINHIISQSPQRPSYLCPGEQAPAPPATTRASCTGVPTPLFTFITAANRKEPITLQMWSWCDLLNVNLLGNTNNRIKTV